MESAIIVPCFQLPVIRLHCLFHEVQSQAVETPVILCRNIPPVPALPAGGAGIAYLDLEFFQKKHAINLLVYI